MAEAKFYHLTRSPLEAALPLLLARALEAGMRVMVRGSDPARMEWLDEKLWLGAGEAFLPHGLAGGPSDADQPILLCATPNLPADRACLMAVDGAEVSEADCAGVQKVFVLFDGNDEVALAHARTQWKALTGAGVKAQYWSEEGGRWQMKAET